MTAARPQSIDRLRELAHTLIRRDGAEAVLLAGTDLSMVMNEENAGFPTLDCAGVHIKAITQRLLGVARAAKSRTPYFAPLACALRRFRR